MLVQQVQVLAQPLAATAIFKPAIATLFTREEGLRAAQIITTVRQAVRVECPLQFPTHLATREELVVS